VQRQDAGGTTYRREGDIQSPFTSTPPSPPHTLAYKHSWEIKGGLNNPL